VKPQHKLAEAQTPDGARLDLFEHDGDYYIRLNAHGLMNSRETASELLLGELGTARISTKPDAKILIGGLGLGFTLKSVLQNVQPRAAVHVAELMPAVVEWNREFLGALNGMLLDDPRVVIHVADVGAVLSGARSGAYDAILLDVDNGPTAMVQEKNNSLYNRAGIRRLAGALRPGGRLAIWSAQHEASFPKRLSDAGFTVEVVRAKRHATARRAALVIYVADKSGIASPRTASR
jgi:spermidine synthase